MNQTTKPGAVISNVSGRLVTWIIRLPSALEITAFDSLKLTIIPKALEPFPASTLPHNV